MKSMSRVTTVFVLLQVVIVSICLLFLLTHHNTERYNNTERWRSRSGESTNQWMKEQRVVSPKRLCTDFSNDTYLIPSEEILEPLSEKEMTAIYWRYINTLQTLCRNVFRFGSFRDGGKEICIDQDFRPQKPCLVYSFGSNNQFDFENEIVNIFGCEVHTFDPSMNVNPLTWKPPAGVVFHKIGLWGEDTVSKKNWNMRTLDTIVKDLGHENRTIDIVKMDVESGEWSALPHALGTGVLRRVKQIAVEIHYEPEHVSGKTRLGLLRALYEGGFHIFMRDRNPVYIKNFKTEFNTHYTMLNEISLLNMIFKRD